VLGGGYATRKSKVSYYFDDQFCVYQLHPTHPKKPIRVKMTDTLVKCYGLDKQMESLTVDENFVASVDLTKFHSDDYVDCLRSMNLANKEKYMDQFYRYAFGEDCPVFDNMLDYCLRYTAGTLVTCDRLTPKGGDEITINWAGGLHHAKKFEASGFCYVNDCVLGIVELLKTYQRVLYIDIDCHHGDGVEEAFFTTDRVMTASFHKYGDFFPGTGAIDDVGVEDGKYYSVNFPFKDGNNDETFLMAFKPVMKEIIDRFRPEAIMMQCGADSLCGDRLGMLNLSIRGHGEAVKYIKSFGIPLNLVGGGGYTLRNVPRCWTYETSVALGVEIEDQIPENDFSSYFHPTNSIHAPVSNQENCNSRSEIEAHTKKIIENLKHVRPVTVCNGDH
jgi:histone deacetylase 1/2